MAIDPEKLKIEGLNPPPSVDIGKELAEQKEILLKIYVLTRKTRRYIMISKILSIIYFLLIIVPVILAIIYLPPLMESALEPYQELLGQTNNLKGVNVDKINNILNQFGQ